MTTSWSWNSGQTSLAWSWLTADGQTLASGELTWRGSYAAPEAHAADPLDIAEQGLVKGCPPARLPALARHGAGPGVSRLDARSTDLAALQGELADALREHASSGACAP